MQLTRALVVVAALAGSARADDEPPPTPIPPPPAVPATDADSPFTPPGLYYPPPPPQQPAEGVVASTSEPTTAMIRLGMYSDGDQTTVKRLFGSIAHAFGDWQTGVTLTIDAVTSASVDVRSSPNLSKVDVVTSASGRSSTSGGQMTDTRYQLTGLTGWKDTLGHALTATGAVASETDYASVSGGLNGSYDILDRNATLLGGVSVTDNWVSSVLDDTIHRKMFALGWSAGIARVLTRDDAIRLRYDGRSAAGYLSSPYRNVRFGDWMATQTTHVVTFTNTIGSADGLPEHTPDLRIGHALVLEWVHSLALGIGVHPEVRLAHDSWGIDSISAGAELRVARGSWRVTGGYRYYAQTAANFFLDKYSEAPATYANYTSDKELGHERGQTGRLNLGLILVEAKRANDTRLILDLQIEILDYRYPGFALLPARDGTFVSIGLGTEAQ